MEPAQTSADAAIKIGLATLGVVLASVGFGLVPYFARTLTEGGLAPHAVAFYRYVLTALILFPFTIGLWREWRTLLWGAASGFVIGLGWVAYVAAVQVAPVSTVGVLYMTYPVFTLGLAWLLFREQPSRRALMAAGLVIVAAVLASSPAAVPVEMIPMLVLSLAAPFGFGLGISVLVHRLSRIPPLGRISTVCIGSCLGLLPLILSSTQSEVVPGDMAAWMQVAGLALATALVPQLVYVVCSPMIGTARSAIAGSIELPAMFIVAWALIGEEVGALQWVACAIIVGAIALTQTRVTRNVAVNMAREGQRPE